MKTILVTVFDSFIAKNILRTDVLPSLLKHSSACLVLVVDEKRGEEYRRLFGGERVVIEGVNLSHVTKLESLWVSMTLNTIDTATLAIQTRGGPLSPRKNAFVRGCIVLWRLMFNRPSGRRALRFLDLLFFRKEPFKEIFERYKPEALFATNIFAPLDVEMLREAKRRNIRTIGMVKSWDNITSKGLVRQLPDFMLVHNERIAEEVFRYADLPRKRIIAVGMPHYDIYFRADNESREAFWRRYGIDSSKKVILYLEPGLKLAPNGHEMWSILDGFSSEGRIKEPAEIFISVHPAYPVKEEVASSLVRSQIVRLGYRLAADDMKTWELSEEALLDLMRAVRYSDLVINTGSTMNIESSIFDKPIINIAFDGNNQLPYQKSVRQYYDYSHLRPIVESGGVKIAYTREELLEQINFLFAHPEWGRAGRRKIVLEQCLYTDGMSGERLGKKAAELFSV